MQEIGVGPLHWDDGVCDEGDEPMRGRKPHPLELSAADVETLQRLAKRQRLPWYQVQRARVVLAVAAGERIQSVATRMECDPSTVWRTCQRYQEQGLEGLLEVAPRVGRPLEISPPAESADCTTGVSGTDC